MACSKIPSLRKESSQPFGRLSRVAETVDILTVSKQIFLATNVTKKLDHYKENDIIKQFMKLLNQQNMGEQSQGFMELFRFVWTQAK